jgi:hypothetical protein
MFESECAGWKSRLHIEDGVGMNSYLGAFHFGRGAAANGWWHVVFGRAAFLSGPGELFNSIGLFFPAYRGGGGAS